MIWYVTLASTCYHINVPIMMAHCFCFLDIICKNFSPHLLCHIAVTQWYPRHLQSWYASNKPNCISLACQYTVCKQYPLNTFMIGWQNRRRLIWFSCVRVSQITFQQSFDGDREIQPTTANLPVFWVYSRSRTSKPCIRVFIMSLCSSLDLSTDFVNVPSSVLHNHWRGGLSGAHGALLTAHLRWWSALHDWPFSG